MPLNLVGETPFGVIFAKSDGSQVTVPHDLAGPLLAAASPPAPGGQPGDVPDVPPVPAGAPAPIADQPPAPATPGMFRGLGGPPGTSAVPAPAGAVQPSPAPATAPPPAAASTVAAPPKPAAPAPSASSDPAKLILQAGQDASNAQLAEGDAQARHLDETAPKLEAAYKSTMAANAAAEIDFKRFMSGVDEQSKAIGQQIADLSKQRINPNAWFQGQSGVGQFLTLLSIAAGGYGAAATGGQNTGLNTVNRMIDQNIQAQVSNLQNQRDLTHDRMTLLQQDVARGMDVHSAVTKARAVALEQTAKLIELEAAKSGSDVVRANAANLAAKSREAAAKTFADFYSQRQQVAASYYATNSANMREKNQLAATSALHIMSANLGYVEKQQDRQAHLAGEVIKVQQQQAEAANKIRHEQEEQARKLTIVSPITGSPVGMAQTDHAAEKAREMGDAYVPLINAAVAYRNALLEYGPRYGGPGKGPERQRLEVAHAAYFRAARKWGETGANLTENEIKKELDPVAPSPQGVFSVTDPLAAVDASISNFIGEYNARIKTFVPNAQPIAPPTFEDKGGKLGAAQKKAHERNAVLEDFQNFQKRPIFGPAE